MMKKLKAMILATAGCLLMSVAQAQSVRESIRLVERVWLSDRIDTPFILGLFRPRIYLPASLEETLREPALRHERTHLRRGDPWWKLLGWLILSVFWFSPFLWLCWFLFCGAFHRSIMPAP